MKKMVILAGICTTLLIIAYLAFKHSPDSGDPRGNLYAGSGTCAKCHSNQYNEFLHTAHYAASLPASETSVHGSFLKDLNEFKVNDSQKVVMEKLDSGLYQTYYLKNKIKERYRFDIVFGNVKGESYLYWKENKLYQLPISYFKKENQWSTSPGYGFDFLNYPHLRSIAKQCMECHSSYIDNPPENTQQFSKEEEFNKGSLVYSIDCERCHGPGKKHADFQSQNPETKTSSFITSYISLNRSQRIDMCAVCHSGKPTVKLRSTFEFVPGDTFANFKIPELFHPVDTGHLDVHGNQVQLLQSSKCYINSSMDCATCHDTHQNSRGNDLLYTEKCLNCHNAPNHTYCKLSNMIESSRLKANCISCHMPALPTKVISVQVSDRLPTIQFFVHTHHIANYPEEVKKVL